jgi:hypothetical protein
MELFDANVFDYGFTGRCPSKAQVLKVAKQGVKSGAKQLNIWWGENGIEFNKAPNGQWYGYGWIRRTGGQDMAGELV